MIFYSTINETMTYLVVKQLINLDLKRIKPLEKQLCLLALGKSRRHYEQCLV